MPERSLEARVAAIEAQLAGKTLETHFREHAELIEQLLVHRFEDADKRWDRKLKAGLGNLEANIDITLARLDSKIENVEASLSAKLTNLEVRFEGFDGRLVALQDAVRLILERLP